MFGQIKKKKKKKRLFRSLIFPLFLCLQSYPNSLSNFPSFFCCMLLLQVPVRARFTIYKLKCSSEQCRKDSLQEEARRRGSLLLLSDLVTTVTCSNSKSSDESEKFQTSHVRFNEKTKYTNSCTLLLPSFLSPSHKRASQRRITF